MPEDVEVGAGYVGSILAERFPDQYRDAGDVAVQTFDTSGHYEQAPGAVVGHPRATDAPPGHVQPPSVAYGQPPYNAEGRVLVDPDQGREMRMVDMPGVGPVAISATDMGAIVPVDYPQPGEGGGWGVGAVTPVSHDMADWRGTPLGDLGAGMGGLTESIANLVASGELDQLNRSMFKLSDSIVDAYRRLDELESQRTELKERTDRYPTFISLPGVAAPAVTPIGVANLETAAAIKEGYSALTGFTYMVYAFQNAFTQSAPQLRKVYNAIDSMLQSMQNWLGTWEQKIRPRKGQAELFGQIQGAHNRLFAQAAPGRAMDFNADIYLPTAMAAVEEVTGVKTDIPPGSGAGILISTLIAVIVGAVALVGSLAAILGIVSEFNERGRALHEQRIEYEQRMEERRKAYYARREFEGASAQEIEAEWAKLKAEEDKVQDQKEKAFAERGGGPSFWEIVKRVAVPAAIVVGGAVIFTQVAPKLI